MYLHNKNHRILNAAEGFGSLWMDFSTTDWEPGKTKSITHFSIALSLQMVKRQVGVASNYCQNLPHDQPFDMDNCLGQFYAQRIGCLSPWETYTSPEYPLCPNSSQHESTNFEFCNLITSTFKCLFD